MINLESLKNCTLSRSEKKVIFGGSYCYTGAGERIEGPNGEKTRWSNDAVFSDGSYVVSGADYFVKTSCMTSVPGCYDYNKPVQDTITKKPD